MVFIVLASGDQNVLINDWYACLQLFNIATALCVEGKLKSSALALL